MKYVGNISVQKEDIQYVMNAVTNTGRDRGQVNVLIYAAACYPSGHGPVPCPYVPCPYAISLRKATI